jgi:hypothetical protein
VAHNTAVALTISDIPPNGRHQFEATPGARAPGSMIASIQADESAPRWHDSMTDSFGRSIVKSPRLPCREAARRRTCAKGLQRIKLEFNGHMVLVAGEAHKIAKSTRGRETLNRFVEDVVAWLQDNYAPPMQALEPASFKQWRDTVMEGPDNYIDWLVAEGVLKW